MEKMREICKIILHCTATKPSMDIGVAEVDRWHKARGWKGCGYHAVVRRDGEIEWGREYSVQGAHVRGENADSIGIAYAGGIDENGQPEDNMTQEQFESFEYLIETIRDEFGFIPVKGHNDYSYKACPSFKVDDKFPGVNG